MKKMKLAIKQLSAGIIVGIGFTAIIFFTVARAHYLISTGKFILGMLVTVLGLILDLLWINKHFVDGEWV